VSAGAGLEERAAFLKRFERFGAEPSVATYLALFHADAVLFDDGMERPIGVAEIPAHIAGVLALVKGFRMRPERWRARGPVVMVEAHNAGEVAGKPVSWRAVYRIELEGSLVRNGRRYFDRAPLLAALDPNTPSVPRLARRAMRRLPRALRAGASPEQWSRPAPSLASGRPERSPQPVRMARSRTRPAARSAAARSPPAIGASRPARRPPPPRRWAGDDAAVRGVAG
jgi:hypothetical protein